MVAATTIPDSSTEKPPRPRLWIPASLRLLFVIGVVAFTAVSLRAYRNASAIREIERLGGEVSSRSRAPEWLQSRIHDERMKLFDEVVRVNLGYAPVTDACLAHVEGFSSLEGLWLDGTRVTDAGLVHLEGLRNLEALGLDHARVGDAGLAHLSRLTSLQMLVLDYTQVTDAGLVHLKGLTNLGVLRLDGTAVTDAGIDDLQRALPEASILRHNPWDLTLGYPFRRSHSPRYFAGAGLLLILAVAVGLFALIFLFPIAAVIRAAVWATRHTAARSAPFGGHSRTAGAFLVRPGYNARNAHHPHRDCWHRVWGVLRLAGRAAHQSTQENPRVALGGDCAALVADPVSVVGRAGAVDVLEVWPATLDMECVREGLRAARLGSRRIVIRGSGDVPQLREVVDAGHARQKALIGMLTYVKLTTSDFRSDAFERTQRR